MLTGMKELLEYIYSRGHRKIAYIHGAMSAVTSGRLSSFYRTAERLGLEIPDEYIREAAYRDTTTTYRVTNELLDLPDPPTCIIYPDDFASFGGINAIRQRGLQIPEDISVAGYDGIQAARQLEPRLTTVQQDTEQIGCLAARELISLIERPKTTIIEQVIVPGKVAGRQVGGTEFRQTINQAFIWKRRNRRPYEYKCNKHLQQTFNKKWEETNMKKKVLSALLTTAMLASMLVGCGSSNDAPAAASSEAAPAASTEAKPRRLHPPRQLEPAAAEEGKVFNIYCWNEEFKSRLTDHYPGYEEVDGTTGKIGDITVKWNITPSDDNAYQNNLDANTVKAG